MPAPNGPVIQAARISRGIKRSDLAERVGCSYSAIYNLERNLATGSIELLQRIATELDLELDEVVKNKPAEPRRAPTSSPQPSRPIAPPRETKTPNRHHDEAVA